LPDHSLIIFILVPLELPIVKREVFNDFYSSSSYYLALATTDIPLLIINTSCFVIVTYLTAGLESFKSFLLIACIISLTSQAIGLFFGSIFSQQNLLLIGVTFVLQKLALVGIFLHLKSPSFMFLLEIDYLHQGIKSLMVDTKDQFSRTWLVNSLTFVLMHLLAFKIIHRRLH